MIIPPLFVGLFGLILLGVPVAFALLVVSAAVLGWGVGMPLWLLMQRVFVGLDSFVLVSIPFFLLTGNIMNKAGITDKLIRLSFSLVGHIRGALAHVNVVVSMFFAGISGSSTADTAGIGSVLIPAMVKEGYPKDFSVAITAASSTLGVIIPPSNLMIIYAAVTGTSVAAMFLGGAIPGFIIGVGQMALAYIYALKYDYPAAGKFNIRQLTLSFKDAALPLGTPIIILGGVTSGLFTATEASVIAVVYSLFLGMAIYRTINVSDLTELFLETAKLCSLSLFCIGGANIFGWLLAYAEVPKAVGEFFLGFSQNRIMIGSLIVGVFLIVGTFMDAIPAILILVPVLHPIGKGAGIHPVQLGVLVVISLAIGLITPPYGLCLLLASSIAETPVSQSMKIVGVFIVLMCLLLFVLILFPDLILFLPRLITPKFV